jgi:hypothetical protein
MPMSKPDDEHKPLREARPATVAAQRVDPKVGYLSGRVLLPKIGISAAL